jgi:hypothetical protein
MHVVIGNAGKGDSQLRKLLCWLCGQASHLGYLQSLVSRWFSFSSWQPRPARSPGFRALELSVSDIAATLAAKGKHSDSLRIQRSLPPDASQADIVMWLHHNSHRRNWEDFIPSTEEIEHVSEELASPTKSTARSLLRHHQSHRLSEFFTVPSVPPQSHAPVPIPAAVVPAHSAQSGTPPDEILLDVNDDEPLPKSVEPFHAHGRASLLALLGMTTMSGSPSFGFPNSHPGKYPRNITAIYRGGWSAGDDASAIATEIGETSFAKQWYTQPTELTPPPEFEARRGFLFYVLRTSPLLLEPGQQHAAAESLENGGKPKFRRPFRKRGKGSKTPTAASAAAAAAAAAESQSSYTEWASRYHISSSTAALARAFSYVSGELIVRDGRASSSRDLKFSLQGFYSPLNGKVFLFANMRGERKTGEGPFWSSVENLRAFLGETDQSIIINEELRTLQENLLGNLSAALRHTVSTRAAEDRERARARFRERNGDAIADAREARISRVAHEAASEASRVARDSGMDAASSLAIGEAAWNSMMDLEMAEETELFMRHYSECSLSFIIQVAEEQKEGSAATAEGVKISRDSEVGPLAVKRSGLPTRNSYLFSAESPATEFSADLEDDNSKNGGSLGLSDAVLAEHSPHSSPSKLNIEMDGVIWSNSSFANLPGEEPSTLMGLNLTRLVSLFADASPVHNPALSALRVFGVSRCVGCGFRIGVHSTVLHIEMFYSKALNYAYLCSIVTVLQLIFLHRQIKITTESSIQTRAKKISILAIGTQALLDANLCLFHLFWAMLFNPLFKSFVVATFLEFLLFSFFEMRFMLLLYKAHYPEMFHAGVPWETTRRALRSLYCKFYSALIGGLLFLYWTQAVKLFLFALHGFWVPQIVSQAVFGTRKGFSMPYVYGLSALRLVLPSYFYACPVNFMRWDNSPGFLLLLAAWIGVQVATLVAQDKWGPRFFVPKRFLPPKYDYHRSLPLLNLRSHRRRRSITTTAPPPLSPTPPPAPEDNASAAPKLELTSLAESGAAAAKAAVQELLGETPDPGAPDVKLNVDNGTNGSAHPAILAALPPSGSSSTNAAEDEEDDNPCPICYGELDPEAGPTAIMVCPCDHCFHTVCLKRWMQQKTECPVCRAELPLDEDSDSDDEEQQERAEQEQLQQSEEEEEEGIIFIADHPE